jgi:predicted translin family RNA/ssDNA-binding protein
MENNITISEAQKLVAELKGTYLQLQSLNQEVMTNITQLQELNSKMQTYSSILSKFEFKSEFEMTASFASYLAFLGKKIDELSKDSTLKRVEFIVQNSTRLTSFAIWKLVAIITICNAGICFLSFYRA